MAKRIIKKIGGDRLGSGKKMMVQAHGYGYSTHNVGKTRRTSMNFGTLVPMGQWMLTSGSRLRMHLDALITSNALLYQLYGSCKFQIDVFEARMALYNPKMLLNLNDQGYSIADIKFPQFELSTKAYDGVNNISNQQINPSTMLRYTGISTSGQNNESPTLPVTRKYNAMWMLMYYHIGKEYYANKQEKIGVMIHNREFTENVTLAQITNDGGTFTIPKSPALGPVQIDDLATMTLTHTADSSFNTEKIIVLIEGQWINATNVWNFVLLSNTTTTTYEAPKTEYWGKNVDSWDYADQSDGNTPTLAEFDLKAIDRMQMHIMASVEQVDPVLITKDTELPYGASLQYDSTWSAITTTQEGLLLGTYQSDVFNNWLDNATINALTNKAKVKVNEEGEFSINDLNITQKLYNYDMRIGITDGTLDEWRELTYGQKTRTKSLKPVYVGGLSKEILFDMVISTAATEEEPLGSIASRGNFGNKHKGGYVQIDADEEKLVMVIAKITPRLVYNQGNDFTVNLKTLEDLHKPVLDKIGYQNLVTDQMAAFETRVTSTGTLITQSAGKQPAWQWYRTNYDDALGNMAGTENYKVFGREYEAIAVGGYYRIKDLTTYIDPTKFNDVFADQSLGAMNFDVQVGMDATLTMVMSEEVIPGL